MLEHGASMGEGQETVMRAVIVAGSGTGALAGITGTGMVEHELLTLEVGAPGLVMIQTVGRPWRGDKTAAARSARAAACRREVSC